MAPGGVGRGRGMLAGSGGEGGLQGGENNLGVVGREWLRQAGMRKTRPVRLGRPSRSMLVGTS